MSTHKAATLFLDVKNDEHSALAFLITYIVYTLGERLGWLNTYIISLLFLVAALNLLYNIIAIHQRLKTEENRYSRKYWFGSSLNLFTNAGMIGLLLFFH